MNEQTMWVLGLFLLVLAVIAFFAVFKKKGKFRIETPLGTVGAEGCNEQRPSIQIENASAGRDIVTGAGPVDDVSVKSVTAGRDVRVDRRS